MGPILLMKRDIPLFRAGFPIFDRLGAQRIATLGYNGGIEFVDRLTNTLLDFYYDESGYEMVGKNQKKLIENNSFVREEI